MSRCSDIGSSMCSSIVYLYSRTESFISYAHHKISFVICKFSCHSFCLGKFEILFDKFKLVYFIRLRKFLLHTQFSLSIFSNNSHSKLIFVMRSVYLLLTCFILLLPGHLDSSYNELLHRNAFFKWYINRKAQLSVLISLGTLFKLTALLGSI